MIEFLKLVFRTIIICIPVLLIIIAAVFHFILTALRQLVDWALGEQNYWSLENEWFQVVSDLDKWYKLWKHGRSNEDY